MASAVRILVVDDDENIITPVEAILKNEGYAVDVAKSGSEAIKKSKATAYNVVLMDIRLPDKDGTIDRSNIEKLEKSFFSEVPNILLSPFGQWSSVQSRQCHEKTRKAQNERDKTCTPCRFRSFLEMVQDVLRKTVRNQSTESLDNFVITKNKE